jgi:DNA-binding HxlR family transcriptional regulator
MPGKTDLSKLNCSLARTLEVVGDWWTLLIIRDAFLGVRRFGDFQRSLGIAKNILATRLERLVVNDILKRGGSEKRPVYQLTERGRALLPAMVALMQWGDSWLSAERPPVLVTDEEGRPVLPLHLRSGGDEVSAETVRFHPGPGATARTRAFFGELSLSSDAGIASDSAEVKGASRRRPRPRR